MKYVYAQSADLRFKWELDVALTNLYGLDPQAKVVVLFLMTEGSDPEVDSYIRDKYPQAEVHSYSDGRIKTSYLATIRPYLWVMYLSEYRNREGDTYFQVESDVIFRRLPDFSKIPLTKSDWYASDCSSYIAYNPYLKGLKNSDEIVNGMARLTRITRQQLEETAGVGAHWLMKKPTAGYWLNVLESCDSLYEFLTITPSNIQRWTAEMWAQLYGAVAFGKTWHTSEELNFSMANDSVIKYERCNIMHNSGATSEMPGLFYKGAYIDKTPFRDDLSWVDKNKASSKYVEAIKAVVL